MKNKGHVHVGSAAVKVLELLTTKAKKLGAAASDLYSKLACLEILGIAGSAVIQEPIMQSLHLRLHHWD
jgi:hypothetical protein